MSGFKEKWPAYKSGHIFWDRAIDFVHKEIPQSLRTCTYKLA